MRDVRREVVELRLGTQHLGGYCFEPSIGCVSISDACVIGRMVCNPLQRLGLRDAAVMRQILGVFSCIGLRDGVWRQPQFLLHVDMVVIESPHVCFIRAIGASHPEHLGVQVHRALVHLADGATSRVATPALALLRDPHPVLASARRRPRGGVAAGRHLKGGRRPKGQGGRQGQGNHGARRHSRATGVRVTEERVCVWGGA